MATAGLVGRRQIKHRFSMRRMKGADLTVPIQVGPWTASGVVLTIEFGQAVSLNGVPQYVTGSGALPVSAALTGPTTLAVHYPAGTPAITTYTIPFQDPAVRNASGGYVNPGSFAA